MNKKFTDIAGIILAVGYFIVQIITFIYIMSCLFHWAWGDEVSDAAIILSLFYISFVGKQFYDNEKVATKSGRS